MNAGQPQLVRAPAQAVAQDQPIKLEQSFKMLQILLMSSFSCLTFLRGLLPDECFNEISYGGSLNWSATKNGGERSAATAGNTKKIQGPKIKLLKRGSSDEADKLLDWLEHGIFDALEKCYLKAICLAIYLDEDKPNVIFELYTFSFAYKEGIPTGFNIKDISGNEVTTSEAHKNIQQVMRRLISITQNMPPLPDKRFLTIRLQYMDNTPDNYTPKLFRKILPTDSRYQYQEETEDKVLDRQIVGSVSTGIHAISVKVVGFVEPSESQQQRRKRAKITNPDDEIEVPSLRNLQIPQDIDARSRNSGSTLTPTTSVSKINVIGSTSEKQQNIETNGQNTQSAPKTITKEAGIKLVQPQKNQSVSNLQAGGEREKRELETLRKQLGLPNTSMDGLIATQLLDSVMESSSNIELGTAEREAEPSAQIQKGQKPKLSYNKFKEMVIKKRKMKKGIEGNPSVVCECGFAEDDGGMTLCEACGGWVHIDCYGYASAEDEQLPGFFVCYSCLLTSEKALLDRLRDIALVRRALRKLWEKEYPSTILQFSRMIGCDNSVAKMLSQRLEKEGFLVDNSKAKHRKKSAGSYKVVKNVEIEEKMKQYFDPMSLISHHFDIPDSIPNQNDTLLNQETMAPPPSTVKEKSSATYTQASNSVETEQAAFSKHFKKFNRGNMAAVNHVLDSQEPEASQLPEVEAIHDATTADEMDIDPPAFSFKRPTIIKATPPPQAQQQRVPLASPWRKGSIIPMDLNVSSGSW